MSLDASRDITDEGELIRASRDITDEGELIRDYFHTHLVKPLLAHLTLDQRAMFVPW